MNWNAPGSSPLTTSRRATGQGYRPSSGGRAPSLGNPGPSSKYRSKRLNNRLLILALGLCVGIVLVVSILLRRPTLKEDPAYSEHIQAPPSAAFCNLRRPPLICAHGGDTTDYPPNTRGAFQAAVQAGYDCVEVDAARTSDGVLVVLHVRELHQLLGNSAKPGIQVGDLTWSEVSRLKWPDGERVVRVKEAVELVAPYVTCVTLDIKTHDDKHTGQALDEVQIAEDIVQLVHQTSCSNCLVWAKSDQVVVLINNRSPGQRTGLILMNETQEARELGMHRPFRLQAPQVVGSHFPLVNTQLVEQLHQHNKQLFAWTVNEASIMHHMLDAGVDALVTNKPAMAREAIDWRMARCGAGSRPSVPTHDDIL